MTPYDIANIATNDFQAVLQAARWLIEHDQWEPDLAEMLYMKLSLELVERLDSALGAAED